MEKVIVSKTNEYDSIVEILEMAISRFDTYHDRYIRVIVKDAQLLEIDHNNRRVVDRRVYGYSSTLSRMSSKTLMGFNPDALTKKDFQELLAFFRSL